MSWIFLKKNQSLSKLCEVQKSFYSSFIRLYRELRILDLNSMIMIHALHNRMVKGNQHTVRFHVDDLLSSHFDPKVNDQMGWILAAI